MVGLRGTTPEDPAAQEAELEDVADIRADASRGMDTAGNRFICGSDERADEFSLPDSPGGQSGLGASVDAADGKQDERHGNRHEPAEPGMVW
jgi:hypothetical protein